MKETHLYLDNNTNGSNGYGITACGLDGAQVGGLIPYFFGITHIKRRCKKCNKKYNKIKSNLNKK